MTADPYAEIYLVELYRPGLTEADVVEWADRLRRDGRGQPDVERVRLVRSVLVPGDGCLLCEVAGPSAAAVRAAYERARIPADRVSPAIRHDEAGLRPREEQQ